MAKGIHCATLRTLSIAAVVSTFVACISLVVALATDHWQYIKVDRPGLMKIVQYKPELLVLINNNELFFDRTRGIFYRCGTAFGADGDIIKNACTEDMAFVAGFVLNASSLNSTGLPRDLKLRNYLVVSMASLLLAADLFTLISGLAGVTATLKHHRTMYTTAVSFAFLATICSGVSMAIFHGIDYVEKTKLGIYMFPAVLRYDPDYNELQTHTVVSENYSYYLGWLAVFLSCAAAILYLHSRNKLVQANAHGFTGTGTVSSSSTSLFREAQIFSEKSQASSKNNLGTNRNNLGSSSNNIGSVSSVGVNAYDMMDNTDASSEIDSSPTSEGWSPFNELPSDDPIHK